MIEIVDISKSFPGVKALQNVSITFRKGEVHAICGENGAGKTTLMNILSGNLMPDAGRIVVDGHEMVIDSISSAQQLGISIVHQERSLVDSLSVAENLFPDRQPVTSWGFISRKKLFADARTLLTTLNITNVDPAVPVARLPASTRQMIEIARAIAQKPSVLILDEPTASLTSSESNTLFEIIGQLRSKNVCIIYISHRMHEIMQIADRVSVLKDGRFQGTVDPDTASIDDIIRMMVGRDLDQVTSRSSTTENILLEAANVSGRGYSDVSFKVQQGEIFGIAGLPGSGRSELLEGLFGHEPIHSGIIRVNGKDVVLNSSRSAIRQGIAYVPDDRKSSGLFLDFDVSENIASTHLTKPIYSKRRSIERAAKYIDVLSIRTPGHKTKLRNLSGGNQQKVVLAKWLSNDPSVLIVNEPTHGIDVGAKAEIYRLLGELTATGKSVILVSGDLPELLRLCNRIAVMYQGRILRIMNREEATEENITTLASGIIN
jgi:ABC-type sugar transport system ATPase subunit